MTKEEKKLLLKDLSARLPYGVKMNLTGQDGPKLFDFDEVLFSVFLDGEYVSINYRGSGDIEGICEMRPYLRPMSSMTKEEKEYVLKLSSRPCAIASCEEMTDFLNSHHLDWRGLIQKGLALEASEDMYN